MSISGTSLGGERRTREELIVEERSNVCDVSVSDLEMAGFFDLDDDKLWSWSRHILIERDSSGLLNLTHSISITKSFLDWLLESHLDSQGSKTCVLISSEGCSGNRRWVDGKMSLDGFWTGSCSHSLSVEGFAVGEFCQEDFTCSKGQRLTIRS